MPCRPCPNSSNIELLVLCSVQLIIIILLENATPKMLDTKCIEHDWKNWQPTLVRPDHDRNYLRVPSAMYVYCIVGESAHSYGDP